MRFVPALVLLGFLGCAEGAPPYDQLPLRDTLSADPTVVAQLPISALLTLARRFEVARISDDAVVHAGVMDNLPAQIRADRVDQARRQTEADALIVGIIDDRAGWAIHDRANEVMPALPALEGVSASDATVALESQALANNAAPILRGLLSASGAHHVKRVVGWPLAAVAIDDTIYVSASWLVCLSAGVTQSIDGGAIDLSEDYVKTSQSATAKTPPALTGQPAQSSEDRLSGINTHGYNSDAGVWTPSPSSSTSSSSPSADPAAVADSCAACADACGTCADACAASGGEDDAYAADPGADSCSTSSDDGSAADSCNTPSDSGDACASTADSGDPAAACQVSRPHRSRPSSRRALLAAPLFFLLARRKQ